MSLTDVQLLTVETMVEDVPCRFGLYYRRSSGAAPGFPALDLVNGFWTVINAALLDVLSSLVRVMRVTARPLVPTDGVPYEANYDDTVLGTGGAEPLPPSIAMLIRLRTLSLDSRNNGHIYIAGVPENVWVDGTWEPGAFVPLVNIFMAFLETPFLGSGGIATYTPCVVSRWLNGVPRVPPVTFDIDTAFLSGDISQQRRRQSGQQGIQT